jgi:sugar (pentulose or hexulose) kinase
MRTIGIDIGTSSIKAVLVEIDGDAKVTRTVSRGYSADGAPTRDPERWANLARAALLELASHGRPDAIGFTGQMHGFVAVDRSGVLAAPVRLWLDMDGAADLDRFVATQGGPAAIVRKTGNLPLPDFTLAKWLHALAGDPTLTARVHRLYCVKDYVRAALDRNADFVVDANEACGMQMQDPLTGAWTGEILEAARIPPSALPEIAHAARRAGDAKGLRADLAGVPLVVGVGDQATAMRAVGVDRPGTLSLSLGTSGVASLAADPSDIPADWDGGFHLFPTGYSNMLEVIGTVPAFGVTLRWLSRLLHMDLDAVDRLAAETRPGDPVPIFLPYLAGSGAPNPFHTVAASLIGFTGDLSAERLVRAVYDGLARELAAVLEEARALGIRADRVILSGQPIGLPDLTKTLAAFFDAECLVIDVPSASAAGAALIAADHLQAGLNPNLPAQRLVTEKVGPSPAWLAERERVLAGARARAR